MTKEALKLALEALVLNNAEWKRLADSGDSGFWSAEDQDHYKQTNEAIIAIKEALEQRSFDYKEHAEGLQRDYDLLLAEYNELKAQQEQEPVAWFRYESFYEYRNQLARCTKDCIGAFPVYTSPPQHKPLSDEEIGEIAVKSQDGTSPHDDTLRFARAIEAALRSKNT